MKNDPRHIPVLLTHVLRVLNPRPGQLIVDCTLGLGGHSEAILRQLKSPDHASHPALPGTPHPTEIPPGKLIGIDFDPANIAIARERLQWVKAPFEIYHNNFAALPTVLIQAGLLELDESGQPRAGVVDALLADIGVASTQIDDPARGFSYRRPGPLDMRMDPTRGQPASALINRLTEKELAAALLDYGDETDAPQIARLIVQRRAIEPITRTEQLSDIVCQARDFTPQRALGAKLHPAARTFQALRILTNRELANLDRLLTVLPTILKPGGIAAIITFHSGEDRRVKHAFRDGLKDGLYSEISPQPLTASPDEAGRNPRARSAKLRWARRHIA